MQYLVLVIVCYLFYQYVSRNRAAKPKNVRRKKDDTVIDIQPEDYTVEISPLPYRKKEYLLNAEKKGFYEVLAKSLHDQNVQIFCLVSSLALFSLPEGFPEKMKYMHKIKGESIDFLVCDRLHTRPKAAVILDSSAGKEAGSREKDRYLDQVFKDAGLPLLRIAAQPAYSVEDIRSRLLPYL